MLNTYPGEVATATAAHERGSIDDITIMANPPTEKRRPRWLRWAVVLIPWLWFLVRDLHPLVEAAAILLPVLIGGAVGVVLLFGAYFRSLPLAALAASLTVLYLVAVLAPGRPVSAQPPIAETARFGSINLAQQFFTYNDLGFFVEDRELSVFFGTELQRTHDAELRTRFEHGLSDVAGEAANPSSLEPTLDVAGTYREDDFPSIGLYSDFPITILDDPISAQIPGGLPGFRAQLATDQGDIVVYALHVPRPGLGSGLFEVTLSEQNDMLEAIADAVEAEDLPVVVLGDLNIVDRGAAFDDFTDGLDDAMRSDRWARATRSRDLWHILLQLRIDHILISDGLCSANAQSPQLLLSNHDPVMVDIGPCAAN